MRPALLLGLMLCATGCHRFKGTEFSASYHRMREEASTAPPCAGLSGLTVRDTRADVGLVGSRSRDDDSQRMPIRIEGDTTLWARQGFEEVARASGLSIGQSQYPSMVVTLRSLELTERVGRNADYQARLLLETAVVLPTGQTCFVNSYEGEAKNFGRAGSEENYQETINHALELATVNALNAVPVREALCGKCPAQAPAAAPATPTGAPPTMVPL